MLLLVVSSFLPLPGRNAGLISLPFSATSPTDLQASSYGWGGEGVSKQPDDDRSKNESAAKVENGKASEDKSKSIRSGDQPETTSDRSKSKSKDSSSAKNQSSQRDDSSKPKESNGKPKESNDKSDPTKDQKSPTDQGEQKQSEKSAKDRMKSNDQVQKESENDEKEPNGSQKNPEQKNLESKDQPQQNQEEQKEEREQQESDTQRKDESPTPPQEDSPSRQKSSTSSSTSSSSSSSPRSSALPQSPPWLGSIPGLIKWLTVLLLLGVIIAFLMMHGREWLATLQSLFSGSPRGSSDAEVMTASVQAAKPLAAFSAFENPFLSGKGWQSVEIVRHTFEAMEAWGRERGMPRAEGETPEEYLSRLAFRFANVREELNRFSRVYNRLAYAAATVQTRDVQPLANLWKWMTTQT